jgi:ABC-2 type transport system permease protein
VGMQVMSHYQIGTEFRGKKQMIRYASILGAYFFQYLKARLAYQGDFLIALFTSFCGTLAGFSFIYILFNRINALHGWNFEELVFIFGFSICCLGFFNVLSLNLYEFGERYIIEGRFDQLLLRPLHSLFQVLFESFRIESFQEVITGGTLIIYASHRLHLNWPWWAILLFPVMLLSGILIYLSVFTILTSVSFWFEDRIGITPPVYNMIPFGRYPTSIYNVFLQFMLSWIIPFAFASFYPSTLFLQRNEYTVFFMLTPVVALVFVGFALILWNFGVKNYQSVGN